MAQLPAIGSVVAQKYRIEALLGQGGMGAVFRARHELMDKLVALKWLHPDLAENLEARDRFIREAKAAARIRHPNVVDVHDVGVHEGSFFMVMDLLEGESFEQVLERGSMPMRRALRLLIGAMRGVAAAHQRGIVHRDIKPDNVFIIFDAEHPEGLAKVLDFGISKLADEQHREKHLTQTGATMGTPLYMSLEQLNGAKDVDARSDVYSFGVMLYRTVTGKLPFDGETFASIAIQVATRNPPSPRQLSPELPAAFDAIVMKAMAREREQRYPNLEALIDALAAYEGTEGSLGGISRMWAGRGPAQGGSAAELTDKPSVSSAAGSMQGSATSLADSYQRATFDKAPSRKLGLAVALALGAALTLLGIWLLRDKQAVSPPPNVAAAPRLPTPSPAASAEPAAATPQLPIAPEPQAVLPLPAQEAAPEPSHQRVQESAPTRDRTASPQVARKRREHAPSPSPSASEAPVPSPRPTPAAVERRSGQLSLDDLK